MQPNQGSAWRSPEARSEELESRQVPAQALQGPCKSPCETLLHRPLCQHLDLPPAGPAARLGWCQHRTGSLGKPGWQHLQVQAIGQADSLGGHADTWKAARLGQQVLCAVAQHRTGL